MVNMKEYDKGKNDIVVRESERIEREDIELVV